MAGRGPAPKQTRRRHHAPERGEWQHDEHSGWQYGDIPQPTGRLLSASRAAWDTWFRSWFAAHWTPEDLPGLRALLALYDAVARGDHVRAGELRMWMDTYGITPKGQQDRRWVRPKADPEEDAPEQDHYAHLRVLADG